MSRPKCQITEVGNFFSIEDIVIDFLMIPGCKKK
jgi:hypothetical protein